MNETSYDWIDWSLFEQTIIGHALAPRWPDIRSLAHSRFADPGHGDQPKWIGALRELQGALRDDDTRGIREALQRLHPWRKGPLRFGSVSVDTEWRSDRKWKRFLASDINLHGKVILDVGCGNGYYMLQMLQQGARAVLGIDPTMLYVMQFLAICLDHPRMPATVLPFALEDLPSTDQCFDVVFSFGVLSHRRSPFEHLSDLRSRMAPDATLVLETLVLQDAPGQVLVPVDRYAQMRNVWFIPDVDVLLTWLARAGFRNWQVVDVSPTTVEEQRTTDWMKFQSLAEGLDPARPDRTIEGHPAPVRAMVTACGR